MFFKKNKSPKKENESFLISFKGVSPFLYMRTRFNPFTKKLMPKETGGKYGVNVETLTGDKTLVPSVDLIYQYLDPDDVNRIITLADGKVNDHFIINHNGNWNDVNYLEIKVGTTTYDKLYVGIYKEFIYDGSDWLPTCGTGHGTQSSESYRGLGIGRNVQVKECGVAFGMNANAVLDGVSIGYSTDAHDYGVAIGYDADGYSQGVAIGHGADGHNQGTALGRGTNTNSKAMSVALGFHSKCIRYSELAMNIDGDENQYNQIIIGSWSYTTTNNTPIEIFCAGMGGAGGKRFTIQPQSALTFKIMVTARDDTTGDCAAYLFDGLIKRDNANNTTLCVCNKTVLHEDDDTWDCDVAADDTNETLQITVTGDADNTVKWASRLDGVETHY